MRELHGRGEGNGGEKERNSVRVMEERRGGAEMKGERRTVDRGRKGKGEDRGPGEKGEKEGRGGIQDGRST